MKKIIITIIIGSFLATAYPVWAYVMSSSSYRLQSDAVSVGGVRQTSTSYISEDTIGEIATGISTSASYKIKAGFQQMQEIYLSITAPDDVTLTPDIGGVSGGTANGSATWTVLTDNAGGYSLSIEADTSPALQSGTDDFTDYIPVSGNPDFDWLVDSANSEFGFTPEGSHIIQKYKDDGDNCNAGTNDTPDSCWYNLSTSNETIGQSYLANHPSGTNTTVKFRAQSGSSHVQQAGTYTSTVTLTVISN